MKSRWFLIGCFLLMGPICLLARELASLDETDGLPNNRVTSIYKDRAGFLWITTLVE